MSRLRSLIATVPAVLFTAGCTFGPTANQTAGQGPGGKSVAETTTLSQAKVPADFTFAATQSIDVTVQAGDQLLKPGQVAGVEVTRPDGKVLYRGPVFADRPARIALAIPLKDKALSMTLRFAQIEKQAMVDIVNRAASHTFE